MNSKTIDHPVGSKIPIVLSPKKPDPLLMKTYLEARRLNERQLPLIQREIEDNQCHLPKKQYAADEDSDNDYLQLIKKSARKPK